MGVDGADGGLGAVGGDGGRHPQGLRRKGLLPPDQLQGACRQQRKGGGHGGAGK